MKNRDNVLRSHIKTEMLTFQNATNYTGNIRVKYLLKPRTNVAYVNITRHLFAGCRRC